MKQGGRWTPYTIFANFFINWFLKFGLQTLNYLSILINIYSSYNSFCNFASVLPLSYFIYFNLCNSARGFFFLPLNSSRNCLFYALYIIAITSIIPQRPSDLRFACLPYLNALNLCYFDHYFYANFFFFKVEVYLL